MKKIIKNVCLIVLLFFLVFNFRLVFVQGCSMEPTLHQDDVLIVNTLNKSPKIGDIVIIKPLLIFKGDYVIKRVTKITDSQVFVEGDNKQHSYDSREVGWINKSDIFGTIIFK